jgi:hypothetical protein
MITSPNATDELPLPEPRWRPGQRAADRRRIPWLRSLRSVADVLAALVVFLVSLGAFLSIGSDSGHARIWDVVGGIICLLIAASHFELSLRRQSRTERSQ